LHHQGLVQPDALALLAQTDVMVSALLTLQKDFRLTHHDTGGNNKKGVVSLAQPYECIYLQHM
jgi:hypothetical protein